MIARIGLALALMLWVAFWVAVAVDVAHWALPS